MGKLELQGLCKGFDFPVLDRLDLTVEEGEFFVVVGPSGIGKTTLLRCIAGLETPEAGRVLVGGADVTRVMPYKRKVAMTFESYALYPHLSVFENIASPLRARRVDKATVRARVTDIARRLRIESLLDRRPGEISGGQKQRTALGRTLAADPEIFLLDEPISHLDAKIRHELRQEFHNLDALRRVATVYVTHDYAEALSLGDRIGVMGRGGLVQTGTAREVFLRPRNLFVAQHLGQPSINLLTGEVESREGVIHVVCDGGALAIPVAAEHRTTLSNGAGGPVRIGIRPQHLSALAAGQAAEGRFVVEGRVEMFQALGASGVLSARAGALHLTVLASPDRPYRAGEPVRLALDTRMLHFFDAASGDNLLL